MYVSFDSISDNARLWVYQSSRELTTEEIAKIEPLLEQFINQWTAHGNNLQASYKIYYNRFIALAVDENLHNATGCSIDSSVNFMRSLAQNLNVDLFDRTQIAFKENDEIKIESLNNFKNKVKSGELATEVMVFNNAISLKKELEEKWILPLAESWAGRFLPSTAI
ncbi:hypothetical protein [Fulvivirga lutea]|uniref:ABC transporter ATPase n=1 Tax=Fulvivirga lutea TaxID=2810512 RepID=A0A974WMP1_9BACT|nr:hypothetical protein [Fulvivirga lutea]QSE98268.1 hypothetical protein JR347_04090 [Fulvivirga lutea]